MAGRWRGRAEAEGTSEAHHAPARRDDGQLSPGVGSRGRWKCPNSHCIWKAQPTGCADRLDERKSNE